jgi:hypothetical protein
MSHLIGTSPLFLEHWASSIKNASLPQIEAWPAFGSPFTVYIHVQPRQNNMPFKMRYYWEHLREHIGNSRNILRTWCEHSEKTLGTEKKIKKSPSQKPKRKKPSPPWALSLAARQSTPFSTWMNTPIITW